jgi:DNA-binding response OmpR family regulator
LRKKIEVDQPKLIQTVRGVGYRMSEAPNIRLSA